MLLVVLGLLTNRNRDARRYGCFILFRLVILGSVGNWYIGCYDHIMVVDWGISLATWCKKMRLEMHIDLLFHDYALVSSLLHLLTLGCRLSKSSFIFTNIWSVIRVILAWLFQNIWIFCFRWINIKIFYVNVTMNIHHLKNDGVFLALHFWWT